MNTISGLTTIVAGIFVADKRRIDCLVKMIMALILAEIETLFGCLKTKGFRFEETRLMKHDRIKKMIGLLALAFCIAHKTGEWRHEKIKAIVLKKHGRPQYNCFRYGMNWIKEKWYQSTQTAFDAMTRLVGFFEELAGNRRVCFMKILSCTECFLINSLFFNVKNVKIKT